MVPVHKVTRPVDGIDYPRRVVCQFTLHTSSRRFLTNKPEIIIINITSTSDTENNHTNSYYRKIMNH